MTLPLNPDQPLSIQLAALEAQAGTVPSIRAEIDDLTDQIQNLTDERAQCIERLTGCLKAEELLAGIRQQLTAALPIPPVMVIDRAPAVVEPVSLEHAVTEPAPQNALATALAEPTAEVLSAEADTLFTQALGMAQELQPQPRTLKERLLLDIAAHPGTTGAQVIGRLGEPKNRVHPAISTIKHAGLIESATTEVPFEYRLTPAGREAVIALAPEGPTAATTADPDADPEDSPPVPLAEPPGPGALAEDLAPQVDAYEDHTLGEYVQMAQEAAQLALEDSGLTEEDLRDERTDMPDPEPTEASQLNVKAPPSPAARPRPGSNLARLLSHLEADGPATSADLAQGTGILLKEVERCLINLRAKQLVEFKGMYSPSVHQVPGDTRPFQPSRYSRNGHQIPQDELRAALQGHKDRVRKAMVPGREYTETELLKATDLAISHLRRALAALIDESVVRRVEGSTPATRATYALESFDMPLPGRERLNATDRRVLEHLRATTLRGGRDSVGGIADRLGLSRQDVEGTLALLHARRWLKWTRVGALALYALSPFGVDARKDAA